ncbi:MAG: hypothetical protein WCN88_00225 [Candidatus Falkowbacteria bacterium]
MSKLNLRIFLLATLFFIMPFFAKAAVCDQNTILKVTARDPDGSYIAGAYVDVYAQTVDANGNKKPGARIAGGSTDAILGIASISFRNSAVASATYAIRIRTIGKDSASFWFFDNTLNCGETSSISKTLSGVSVSLRQSNGSVLTNTSFSIYTQMHDSSGSLINAKNELLGTYNTGNSGQVKIYLPQGSVRGILASASDHYVIEINHSGIKYNAYNVYISDGAMTNYEYYLSVLRIRLQYEAGASATGATVEVYTQKVNLDYDQETDLRVGSFAISDDGYGSMELAPGTYALKIKVAGVYQYFWDNYVYDGKTTQYNITLKGNNTAVTSSSSSNTTATTCANASKVYVALTDIAGHGAAALKFEIYEQGADINNLPLPGLKVVSGTTDINGRATISFKPDSSKNYALKVWDKKADLGEFWYYNVLKFVCDYDRKLTKSLPSLKIVLRDAEGKPRYNYAFSLYAQRFDVDGNPSFGTTDLIANLKTGADGQAIVYVAPYNTYNSHQTGYYALGTKDGNNNTKNFYNININESKDYTYEPAFSGLSGTFLDAEGRIFGNRSLILFEQKSSDGYFNLGQKLLSFRTDLNGKYKFEYSEGTYAISATDDLGKTNVFWNVVIGPSSTSKKLTASLINFNFTGGSATGPVLQLYTLSGKNGAYARGDLINTIRLKNNHAALSLAAGAYLASYEGSNNRIFGQTFYAKNGYTYNVNFSTSAKYSIIGKTSFALDGAEANLAVAAPAPIATVNSSANAVVATGPLSTRLKGRILLQVEDKGQAWYLNPVDGKRYSLGRPEDAYNVMRRLALGVSNDTYGAIENNPSAWKKLAGRILLKVEDSGKAYYFDPTNLVLYYLGRPADAFNVMRGRGLGITTSNLNQLNSAE